VQDAVGLLDGEGLVGFDECPVWVVAE